MATDIVGGTDGDVTASGFNIDIDSWSAQIQTREETWRPASTEYEKSEMVAWWMNGQFDGTVQFEDTDTEPVPTSTGGDIDFSSFKNVDLTLTATTGCTYTGKANINAYNTQRPGGGRMTGQFSFRFTEVPSQTWATS